MADGAWSTLFRGVRYDSDIASAARARGDKHYHLHFVFLSRPEGSLYIILHFLKNSNIFRKIGAHSFLIHQIKVIKKKCSFFLTSPLFCAKL